MATYPSGVTTFIPEYQAYQPDFNFTANVLQLKQTQYDQNWSRLNNIYGQILNAPLTHDESINRRDNTFKRIDFDLKRITGLDLSLDQNVQQATQLFRPFYEDSSLMKDMAFTKNVGFEKSLGEGKRYNTDEKINSEYWDGGLRAIDYKVQEFKALPYEQLPSFGDVKYTPYVNVEKKALELAAEMKIDIKSVTPQGDWIVTEKNGQQAIAPLQSTFYSVLGKDPKVKEMYATRAYLERKDTIISNKDRPEYGGNAELAEKDYLNRTLKVMKNQTIITKNDLLSRKMANDKMISRMEKSIADGTDIETTQTSLEQYKEANAQISEMLKQAENDLTMLDGDLNSTLTTQGGSALNMDDMDLLRFRVDASTASNLLLADLNQAALNWAELHGEVSYEANPFSVQRQKYQYDSSLIQQRAAAQKDVALYKHQLDMDKATYKAKAESGLYDVDPETNELKIKPELANIEKVAELMTKTPSNDPQALSNTISGLYTGDAEAAKTTMVSILAEMQEEGVLSNAEILEIIDNKNLNSFNIEPVLRWIKENGDNFKEGTGAINPKTGVRAVTTKDIPTDIMNIMIQEGSYVTELEREAAAEMGDDLIAQGQSTKLKLAGLAKSSVKNDFSANMITDMTKKMLNVIDRKKDDPYIRNSSKVKSLVSLSHSLDDYAAYKQAAIKNKEDMANEAANKLRAKGFMYANQLFDDQLNMVDKKTFIANIHRDYPEDITLNTGMSMAGFINAMNTGGLSAASVAAIAGQAGPQIALPEEIVTMPAAYLTGALATGVGYLGGGLWESIYNGIWGTDQEDGTRLAQGNSHWTGHKYSTSEEYDEMMKEYDLLAENSLLTSEILGLDQPVSLTEFGTGLYTAGGAGITIEPGIRSPTYDHYLQLRGVIRNLDLQTDDGSNYVSFGGVGNKFEDIADPVKNNEIWSAIWADLNPRTGTKGMDLKRFQVAVSPFGGEDVTKAAINFRLPEDYLKKFKPDSDGNGIMSEDQYNDMLKNGISIITDAQNLANVSMFKNSFKSAEQIRIEKAGSRGVTYTDPTLPGISLNYKIDPIDPSKIVVTTSYQQYMGPGQDSKTVTLVAPLSNQGANLKYNREKFFTGDASSSDLDGPKIQQLMNQQRREYGGY
jgi:hypothetical protein